MNKAIDKNARKLRQLYLDLYPYEDEELIEVEDFKNVEYIEIHVSNLASDNTPKANYFIALANKQIELLQEFSTIEKLFIRGKRNGYAPDQCGETLTVGELIAILEKYDHDLPVFLVNDNGYSYGSITEDDVDISI